ncbi:uncharacterized protein LOC126792316 [Argentina anserina]|uniref:uncharacterized protein LOC126792316 n=1 Tax=Argentina anserina TaxID=57926 RepID=UPI0021762EEC|nr:uncharacterized protein LOC126792316 [Potentilla anserina]
MASVNVENDGILKSFSGSPPIHYTVKETGFYPNGNKRRNVGGHISLYLVIAGKDSLPQNKRVYSVFEDASTKRKCFNGVMLDVAGFDKLIPIKKIKDVSNGYLVDAHACMEPRTILLYPKGNSDATDSHLSLFVGLADSKTLPSGSLIFADYTLRILDQIHGRHCSKIGEIGRIFGTLNKDWGYNKFIALEMFKQAGEGFLLNDACIIDAEVTVRGITRAL